MTFPRCPHCGKSREGMRDDQECWNCGKKPATAPKQAATPLPPFEEFTPQPRPAPQSSGGASWLLVTGCIGILLFLATLGWGIRLFLHSRNYDPDTERAAQVEQREAETIATPQTSPPNMVQITPTTAVVIDPFAQTQTAQQPTPTSTNTPPPTATPTPTTPTPINCPDAPPTRLTANGQAQVESSFGLKMRDAPTTQGNELVNVSLGEVVTIIGAPECAEGYLWWPVRLNEQEGWMAEGNQNLYFLSPR